MDYKERDGRIRKEENSQDKALALLYSNLAGRLLLRGLSSPVVSKAAGYFMNSFLSTFLIDSFVKKNGIRMSDYKKRKYRSYNEFFTRKLKNGKRKMSREQEMLISPCDGRITAYPVSLKSVFRIKGSSYTLASLLQNEKLAREFAGGYCVIVRLTVGDYHRYCYVDDAAKERNKQIRGRFFTVHPAILDNENIYKENTREYCVLKTRNFGKVVQMEVGALLVGKIQNYHREAIVSRGQEKGKFEFGGSTVVLLFQRDQVVVDNDILKNTRQGFETRVSMGEAIGRALYD